VKKLAFALAGCALAAAAFVTAAPASTTCNGTISDLTISGSVLVPQGARCRLIRDDISGTVQVQPGGALIVSRSHIGGSVQSNGARWFRLDNRSRVDGSVQVTGTTGTPPSFSWNMICESTIGNAVQVTSNHAPFSIGDFVVCTSGNAIGGTVQIAGNDAQVRVSNNAIGHSLQCSGNTPPATGDPGSNRVGGVKQGEGCASA